MQDLTTTMVVVESLVDYRSDSPKVEGSKNSHAIGEGDKISKDPSATKQKKGQGALQLGRQGQG